MARSRLHWSRGRQEDGVGVSSQTLEWVGFDDAGEVIARVVRILGPVSTGWRSFRAVARDAEAKVVELRPTAPPDGSDWLACVGGRVVARAALPLQAVRAAEAALGGE
jgi:hypothetical protein